eukprot:CAMPEP_0184707574 /NCGR_PEP_ID=MMETSP0313-20130426/37338_1 /TAXON_ID=2792 /ORGANISM="Porphyridium aerugineum, Strain SAG 1380-2" /LENGTH=510 /DNA_ID=CAMNT_0027169153 /DNA_START=417 /DNA_END=1949 /DNA_ORIENTATION=-
MYFGSLDLKLSGTDVDEFLLWAKTIREMSKRRIENFYMLDHVLLGSSLFSTSPDSAYFNQRRKSYVVKGTDFASGEAVAIKVVKRSDCSPREIEFVEREAAILMMLDHPAIVETYDIFDSDEQLYIVMKYMEGGNLATILQEQTRFGEKEALEIFRTILCAVASMHRQGIIHRDIRPGSILCESRRWPLKPRLGEFGFGVVVAMEKLRQVEEKQKTEGYSQQSVIQNQQPNASDVNTELSECVGTWAYMSPEQVNREKYGRPVDMWALGVTLYELISGKLPFEGETVVDTLCSITQEPVTFGPRFYGTSSEAKELILALLEKDPNKRITAEEVLKNPWVNPLGSDDRWLADGLEGLQTSVNLLKKIMSYGKNSQAGLVPMLPWRKGESGPKETASPTDFSPFVTPKLYSVDSFGSERSGSSVSSLTSEPLIFGKTSRVSSLDSKDTGNMSPRFLIPMFPDVLLFGVDVDRRADVESQRKKQGLLEMLGEKGGIARTPVFGAGMYGDWEKK